MPVISPLGIPSIPRGQTVPTPAGFGGRPGFSAPRFSGPSVGVRLPGPQPEELSLFQQLGQQALGSVLQAGFNKLGSFAANKVGGLLGVGGPSAPEIVSAQFLPQATTGGATAGLGGLAGAVPSTPVITGASFLPGAEAATVTAAPTVGLGGLGGIAAGAAALGAPLLAQALKPEKSEEEVARGEIRQFFKEPENLGGDNAFVNAAGNLVQVEEHQVDTGNPLAQTALVLAESIAPEISNQVAARSDFGLLASGDPTAPLTQELLSPEIANVLEARRVEKSQFLSGEARNLIANAILKDAISVEDLQTNLALFMENLGL